MTSQLIRFFTAIILISLSSHSWAQESNSIQLISYRDEGRILLRWAPSKASDWLELNKKGYTLERYTIIRNSTRVFPAEQLKMNDSLKPVSLQEWEKISFDNKYAAVVAQAIYGDEFQIQQEHQSTDILSSIQISKEQNLRYSFTILAADQSFEVAQMAGLGFEDIDVHKNEAYMYKLYGNFGSLVSDTAYTIVTIGDVAPLPMIEEIQAEFGDRNVMLTWRSDYYKEVYSSYIIEKSEDNIHYQTLNNIPTITTSVDKTKSLKWMMKSDSLSENEKLFYYRISGNTPFGIVGPPSNIISGFGTPEMDLSIGIIDAFVIEDEIHLMWETVGVSSKRIVKHLIHRSASSEEYILIDSVTGEQNQYIDRNPLASNYYKIVGANKLGQLVWSLPYFVQAEDSIPPVVPLGLTGICDLNGRIELRWLKNREEDVKGYRVFRSRVHGAEYIQVTVEPASDTIYYDTVDLHTLSKKMYYRILAVDNRGNRSSLSAKTLVKLTDIIPPVPPRITGYQLDKATVKISWKKSSSQDVVKIRLFKENVDSITMVKEIPFSDGLTSYSDSTFSNGLVSYFLTAVDSSGNESVKSNVIQLDARVISKANDIKLSITANRAMGGRVLKWGSGSGNEVFRLYKAKDKEPITLYKVFGWDVGEFSDDLLEVNSKYHYRLQVLYDNGGTSVFSNEIDIVY